MFEERQGAMKGGKEEAVVSKRGKREVVSCIIFSMVVLFFSSSWMKS